MKGDAGAVTGAAGVAAPLPPAVQTTQQEEQRNLLAEKPGGIKHGGGSCPLLLLSPAEPSSLHSQAGVDSGLLPSPH